MNKNSERAPESIAVSLAKMESSRHDKVDNSKKWTNNSSKHRRMMRILRRNSIPNEIAICPDDDSSVSSECTFRDGSRKKKAPTKTMTAAKMATSSSHSHGSSKRSRRRRNNSNDDDDANESSSSSESSSSPSSRSPPSSSCSRYDLTVGVLAYLRTRRYERTAEKFVRTLRKRHRGLDVEKMELRALREQQEEHAGDDADLQLAGEVLFYLSNHNFRVTAKRFRRELKARHPTINLDDDDC